jgi:ABC-type oligopeptide transport system substrate-binding subunit
MIMRDAIRARLPRIMKLTLLAAVCVLLLSACAKRETPVVAAIRSQTLHFGNDAEPSTLDAHLFTLVAEWNILNSVFEGLVNLANDGVTILPGVAEHWDVSSDGLVYTFKLRGSARWSNGDPITTADFLASFQRVLTPPLAAPFRNTHTRLWARHSFSRARQPIFPRSVSGRSTRGPSKSRSPIARPIF